MFNILVSQKTLSLESLLAPVILVDRFRRQVGDDSILAQIIGSFQLSGRVVGKVGEREVCLRYRSAVRHQLQPTLQLKIEPTACGGSLLSGRYRLPRYIVGFVLVWTVVVISIGGAALFGARHGSSVGTMVLMLLLFGALGIGIMRFLALIDERNLERFVFDVVKNAELEQLGERSSRSNELDR